MRIEIPIQRVWEMNRSQLIDLIADAAMDKLVATEMDENKHEAYSFGVRYFRRVSRITTRIVMSIYFVRTEKLREIAINYLRGRL